MYSKEKLLEMLSSDKASVRYDACERLRLSKESSPEIVTALDKATNDEDKDIVERAILALSSDVHYHMAIKMGMIEPDKTDEMEQLDSMGTQPHEPGHKRPWCALIWILTPGLCLIAMTLVSVTPYVYHSHLGRPVYDPYVSMLMCAPFDFILGAVPGALAYYGIRTAKLKSKHNQKNLGYIALYLGILLFLALIYLAFWIPRVIST